VAARDEALWDTFTASAFRMPNSGKVMTVKNVSRKEDISRQGQSYISAEGATVRGGLVDRWLGGGKGGRRSTLEMLGLIGQVGQ
jgi:hypothetical protein